MPNNPVRARRARGHVTAMPVVGPASTAVATVLALWLVAGCATGPSSGVAPSRGSPSAPARGVPTVVVVPQPAGGKAGPVLAVEGIVDWVVPGYPACAALHTRHQPPQVLSLVGSSADLQRRAAEAGRGPASEQARIVGHVPPAAATVCPGLTFSVQQIDQVSPMTS
jgi:hypothetical protein